MDLAVINKRFIRQKLKTIVQNVILPVVYNVYRRRPVDQKKVIFADCNSDTLPESMAEMYKKVSSAGFDVKLCLCDIRKTGAWNTLKFMMRFMKEYADARCVFICNYFVPVCSCKKRSETKVVQLWHSCGLMKKFAYDSKEDISEYYSGSVTKNISLITVSSPACAKVFRKALRLKGDDRLIVRSTGVSRTDVYFSGEYNARCRRKFYEKYPRWRNKKIILWAPTFRGTAADAHICGEESVKALETELSDEWAVVIKLHPHVKSSLTNCEMSTSELFSCADLLISDYSSLIFEYALYRKPVVIFAPDLEEYSSTRGLYIDIHDLPAKIVTDGQDLAAAVKDEYEKYRDLPQSEKEYYEKAVKFHCGSCDGKATDRIFNEVFKK